MRSEPTGCQPARGVARPPCGPLARRCCRRCSDLSPGQRALEGDVRGAQEQDHRGLVSQLGLREHREEERRGWQHPANIEGPSGSSGEGAGGGGLFGSHLTAASDARPIVQRPLCTQVGSVTGFRRGVSVRRPQQARRLGAGPTGWPQRLLSADRGSWAAGSRRLRCSSGVSGRIPCHCHRTRAPSISLGRGQCCVRKKEFKRHWAGGKATRGCGRGQQSGWAVPETIPPGALCLQPGWRARFTAQTRILRSPGHAPRGKQLPPPP